MKANQLRNHSLVLASIVLATIALASALAATPWKTEPKQSTLAFVGSQAGAEFKGLFQQFTADIQFDPKELDSSKFSVVIDVQSVNSKDRERDDIIRSADLFSVARWPSAQFVADKFTDMGGGHFVGMGKLTLRDVTRDVPIEFAHQTDATGAWLKGQAKLKRLDFGVGQGEWQDTQWVSNDVRVEFALRLER